MRIIVGLGGVMTGNIRVILSVVLALIFIPVEALVAERQEIYPDSTINSIAWKLPTGNARC
jgi:hypothetical protein